MAGEVDDKPRLAIFDFDKTLIFKANSDPWIIKAFSQEIHDEFFNKEKLQEMDWQDIINASISKYIFIFLS